jgi:4-hydroxy-4-methyl-2-oxoglutarate aldolase
MTPWFVVFFSAAGRGPRHYTSPNASRLPRTERITPMSTARERPAQWVERLRPLYSAVVADVLDKLGYRNQIMAPNLRPIYPEAKVVGFALTVHTVPYREVPPPKPYAGELAAVDALKPNDVMVVSTCNTSYWGELLSTAARYRGCNGVVIDGYTRDTLAIIDMKFPVFCTGIHPSDSLGRIDVSAHNVPINCGGVLVEAGDLILGDYDGIVVIPHAVAQKAITAAEEKVRGENMVRVKLAEGMSCTEAFERYGIL